MKRLPTVRFNKYVYLVIIILFVFLIGRLKWQKDGGLKIGDTMLLMGNFNQEVELSVEQRLGYEAEVQKYDDLIKNFVPGTGEEIDLGNGMIGMVDNSNPKQEWFLRKAQNLSALGENNKAIRSINTALGYYPDSVQALGMLAAVYADAKAYQYGLKTYNKLIELDPAKKMEYSRQIIAMYAGLGEADKAGKLYIEYIKNG